LSSGNFQIVLSGSSGGTGFTSLFDQINLGIPVFVLEVSLFLVT